MNQPIATLNLPNYVINKLKRSGFSYCNDLNFGDFEKQELNLSSLTEAPVTKTALQLHEEESAWHPVRSFIPELNSLLQHEIAPGLITELTGFPGSGKTQLCFYLALGGVVDDGEVFFISTNNNFAPHRLREIGGKYCSDVESVLKKIYCLEIAESVELVACVSFLETWLENHDHIHLLIIDNISWPLKQIHYTERTSSIYTFFQNLRKLSCLHKFGIVITNDLTTRITGGNVCNTASFGDSFYHAINNRILLSKENDLFKAKILKSVINSGKEATFKL